LGLKLGAVDFISKPFAINELQNKIASILKNAQNQKQTFIKSAIHILSKIKRKQSVTRWQRKKNSGEIAYCLA